ncbi:phage tail protein [Aeromonas caviae]
MSQVITNAFEQYWQSSLAAEQPVVLDEFILADIPNLDITSPIDPDTGLPPESQIVHRQNVDQRGRINNNAVAYTIVMDTTVGDFSFNAMYLRNKQNGVIGMIVYKGRETKLKTDQTTGQTGNSLVKSMLMGYDQAAEATLTNVDADTWQIDYAARLRGMDEDIRQLQADLYGHHTFVGDGFKVVETDGAFQVTPGVAIVGGLRVELKQPEVIYPGTKPIGVWVDVHRAGSLLSEYQNHFTIITSVADLADHVDSNGYPHFVAKLGSVQADSTVIDDRGQGSSSDSGAIPDTFALWQRSMAEAGFDLIGQFGSRLTIENANQVLLSKNGTDVYQWQGELPKDVPADATLESTGGIAAGAWVSKGSALLRTNVITLRDELVGGVVYPANLGDYVHVNDVVSVSVTHLRTSFGLLSAWDATFSNQSHTILSLPIANVFAGYDVITDKGTFEFISDSVRRLREANDIRGFGADHTGSTLNDAQIQKIAANNKTLNVTRGQKLRVSTIPTTFTAFTGGGRLIWDNNAAELVVYNMPDNFKLIDFGIETIYRNRLAINANDMVLTLVREYQSDARTEAARYNAVEWQSATSMTVTNHATYNTGARFAAASPDCSLTVNGIVNRVNHVGEGPDGNLHGTDGIKVSGGTSHAMRSLNISNQKCFGTSRDIIDTFVGGGECNISNIWADGFYFNQIEIKSEGVAAASIDNTPHDINISNFNCRPGGLGTASTFAAVMLFNQAEGDNNSSPRRVNISNYNTRRIGLSAAGTYYGVRASGAFDLNFNNTNITQVKDHGLSATRCRNIKLVNSNLHGVQRGASLADCERIKLIGSSLGLDEQSGEQSAFGLFGSGINRELIVEGSTINGATRSLSVENATLNVGKFTSSVLNGPARVDVFTDIEFIGTNVDAKSTPASNIDCFLSDSATPSSELKFIGGKLMNGRRGINELSLTLLRCIGTTFENTNAPIAGGSADNRRIILGCVSNGGGSFPSASGSDQIANNIVL